MANGNITTKGTYAQNVKIVGLTAQNLENEFSGIKETAAVPFTLKDGEILTFKSADEFAVIGKPFTTDGPEKKKVSVLYTEVTSDKAYNGWRCFPAACTRKQSRVGSTIEDLYTSPLTTALMERQTDFDRFRLLAGKTVVVTVVTSYEPRYKYDPQTRTFNPVLNSDGSQAHEYVEFYKFDEYKKEE